MEGWALINDYQFCTEEDLSLFGNKPKVNEEIKIVSSPRSPSTKMQIDLDVL